jgi:hypothetical protein
MLPGLSRELVRILGILGLAPPATGAGDLVQLLAELRGND